MMLTPDAEYGPIFALFGDNCVTKCVPHIAAMNEEDRDLATTVNYARYCGRGPNREVGKDETFSCFAGGHVVLRGIRV